jgi:hypothetical protein
MPIVLRTGHPSSWPEWTALVSLMKYRLWLGYLIIGSYYGWFIFAASSNRFIEGLSRYIPGWLATLIWASWLNIIPLSEGPLDIPENLQVALGGLFLISSLLLPVAFHFYFVTNLLLLGLVCIERFVFLPRWHAKRNRRGRQSIPVSPNATTLKIAVMADGRITMDGSPTTIDSLRVSLKRLANQKGAVWYYREAGQTAAPPEAAEIMKAVIENQLPIRLSSRPDYSDAVGSDGRPVPAESRTQ